ncbi:iron uptake transporter deferrochelatase/peroxidase subunit [Actinoplanes sp. NPDC049681]|uniref:iron uptake transporter deferrochelatase/peroxidase subunit n=1 Tax=Actinoplanes sp. NPDC049681 TaxID=3363905 RepID=UPI003795CF51
MTARSPSLSRRRMMAGSVLVAGSAAAALTIDARDPVAAAGAAGDAVEFHGPHQAGIVTPAQDRLHFAAFDVVTKDRARLAALLEAWTVAADRMTRGQDAGPVGAVGGPPGAVADDSGEALGLPPAGLTVTFGIGPGLFDRFRFPGRRPAALTDLPAFPGDRLDAARSGGDLCLQVCANDPLVAGHAVRNLARIGSGVVRARWSQVGFGRTSAIGPSQATPRNLFGFKDGTRNLDVADAAMLRKHLWVQPGDGPSWMEGGTYLVVRKIRMVLEAWDRESLGEQEAVVGRAKGTGAPIGRTGEFDAFDVADPRMPRNAHARLAHPDMNRGARMLRRGYTYLDGTDRSGRMDAGLFFLAYQRDPRTGFIPVQTRLSRHDAMNEYVRPVAGALFALPPGTSAGGSWAAELFQ